MIRFSSPLPNASKSRDRNPDQRRRLQRSRYAAEHQTSWVAHLLDRHRLGQVTGEVNVEALEHGEPVGNELQRDDVEDALQDINRLGDLDCLRLVGGELLIPGIADDDGLAAAGND